MELDKTKAIVLVSKLERLIKEQAEEKHNIATLEEQELNKEIGKIKEIILKKEATVLEWKEIRVENPHQDRTTGFCAISDLVYDSWRWLSKANCDEFHIIWVNETRTAIIPYVEYNNEILFVNKDVDLLGLPYLTDATIEIALKLKILVKIKERYKVVVDDVIKTPQKYAYKIIEFKWQKKKPFTGYDVAEYFLSCMDE